MPQPLSMPGTFHPCPPVYGLFQPGAFRPPSNSPNPVIDADAGAKCRPAPPGYLEGLCSATVKTLIDTSPPISIWTCCKSGNAFDKRTLIALTWTASKRSIFKTCLRSLRGKTLFVKRFINWLVRIFSRVSLSCAKCNRRAIKKPRLTRVIRGLMYRFGPLTSIYHWSAIAIAIPGQNRDRASARSDCGKQEV